MPRRYQVVQVLPDGGRNFWTSSQSLNTAIELTTPTRNEIIYARKRGFEPYPHYVWDSVECIAYDTNTISRGDATMSRHEPTPGGMHFVYRFTIHRPGRSEPHVVDVQSFAAGADLKRMLDDRGWTYEITGREPEFARLEA